jgi:hypothetical protein
LFKFNTYHFKLLLRLLTVAVVLFFFSCKNSDKKAGRSVDPQSLYFDYRVFGREGDENITVVLSFHVDDEEGDAIRLNAPNSVTLDGEQLLPDSTKMMGYYYEVQKPTEQFLGKHTITFSVENGISYKEEFNFSPPQLLTILPETIQKDSLVLEFSGLEKNDFMRVLVNDTSYPGSGIDRLDDVRNGRLIISKDIISSLSTGPVQIELMREIELPLKNQTKAGGRFRFSYVIKRELILKE